MLSSLGTYDFSDYSELLTKITDTENNVSVLEDEIENLSTSLKSVVDIEKTDYSSSMEWEITNNNNQDATNYITNVSKEDNRILLYSSVSGKNYNICTYIGTPKEGDTVTVKMKLANASAPEIRKNVTSSSRGTTVSMLDNNDGVYSKQFKSDGSPIYLNLFISWAASPTAPVEITDYVFTSTSVKFTEDFVTSDDLVERNLLLLEKAEKSYNPGSGALESSTTRFGTGLIKVKEGLVLKTEGVTSPYIVFFDSNMQYIDYMLPFSKAFYQGVFDVLAGAEYIAITSYTDFDACYIKKIDVNAQHIIPVEYREEIFQPWNQVPALLRKNGVMISYKLPSGENVIEVFNDPGDINLISNNFALAKYWKRLAYTDIVSGSSTHPMKGKTFYSIGDSHRWKWLSKLADLTGGISGGDIFSAALAENEKFYVSRMVAMAKYIVDLYKSGNPVDYIFLEYVHKYFTNDLPPSDYYHYSGDITDAEPFLTQAYYDYTSSTFNNTSEAMSFWNSNFSSIVGGFTPVSNAIIALKTGVKVQTPKFKLSGTATTSGNFTIKFTDNDGNLYQMSIAIPADLDINQALTIVNEIEFSDSGSKWDNLSAHSTITDASIKFTYNGNLNDADANIKMSFDFGSTGIIYDGDWSISTETKDWIRGFKSHDVTQWSNADKWHELYANADAYIWAKAAVELLQREIPTAKIFVWTLNTESWDYENNTIEGNSVLYPDGTLNVQAIYNSDRHKRMVQNLDGWEKVAKYYHLGFIPISEMNSISPANHKYYYASDDVHPTQEGYDRVAEILARNVY